MLNVDQLNDDNNGLDSFIFFIRHAEKELAVNKNENDIQLTSKGIYEAEKLGSMISRTGTVELIKSSPIKTVYRQSLAIIKGANLKQTVTISKKLGDPGVFVSDDQAAKYLFDNYECFEIVDRQLKEEKLPGVTPVGAGVKSLLEDIQKDLNNISGPGVYITHDAIIVPFFHYLTGVTLTRSSWFDYLNGMIICKNDDRTILLCNGVKYDINNIIDRIMDNT